MNVERMVASFISKNPELGNLLPDALREQFEERRDAGRGPNSCLATRSALARFVGAGAGRQAPGKSAGCAAGRPGMGLQWRARP